MEEAMVSTVEQGKRVVAENDRKHCEPERQARQVQEKQPISNNQWCLRAGEWSFSKKLFEAYCDGQGVAWPRHQSSHFSVRSKREMVLIGQMAKCCETGKTLRVLGHAELFEPVGNLLHRGPSGLNARQVEPQFIDIPRGASFIAP
jgi:hypothetical protein